MAALSKSLDIQRMEYAKVLRDIEGISTSQGIFRARSSRFKTMMGLYSMSGIKHVNYTLFIP